ncbi:MAG: deaminase domain-containing protein, partial [Capnocytophaga sp.]|nr:deaminase domain-containing protein [Capnocytophaga sp.]
SIENKQVLKELFEKWSQNKHKLPKEYSDFVKEQDRIWKEAGFVGENRIPWNGAKNIFKATDDEIKEAAERIKAHRLAKNAGTSGNYGYLEGKIGNITKNGEMVRSGAPDDIVEIFDALPVNNKNIVRGENSWLRTTDSEYKMLNRLANELGAKKGKIYPHIKGELKIVSERAYCPSCQGIIQQFNEIFPNIKLILIDGVK